MYLLAPSIQQILKKLQSFEDVSFSGFILNKIFWVQTIIITFIYLLAPFIVQNF